MEVTLIECRTLCLIHLVCWHQGITAKFFSILKSLRTVFHQLPHTWYHCPSFASNLEVYCIYVLINPFLILLIGALAENSRLAATDGIINAFGKLMSSHRGEVQCTITTAKVQYYFSEFGIIINFLNALIFLRNMQVWSLEESHIALLPLQVYLAFWRQATHS